MVFISSTFLAFFAIFLVVFYLTPGKIQPYILLAGNCTFYLWSAPRNGVLLLISTAVGYGCALAMERRPLHRRRLWLILGQSIVLGILIAFKYLDFLLGCLGIPATGFTAFMPVGLSFYTFSVSGYLFDVFRKKIGAEHNFVSFAAFVSFFPAILSGPIGWARNFLPQLKRSHRWDWIAAKAGALRFLSGCVKKLVLADSIAILINAAYADPTAADSGTWLIVAIAYSMQIYWDFAAYSDMAIGIGQILGFTLMENFQYPYFSRTVKSFWKKWHISLTSWFREYLYFPLGGSRAGQVRCYINILIVFAVSGLWHGAAISFLIWGLLNGVYQVAGELSRPIRRKLWHKIGWNSSGNFAAIWQGLITFGLISVAWIFFRAASVDQAIFILKRILLLFRDGFLPQSLAFLGMNLRALLVTVVLGTAYTGLELLFWRHKAQWKLEHTTVRYTAVMLGLLLLLAVFGAYGEGFNPQDFVYFRF